MKKYTQRILKSFLISLFLLIAVSPFAMAQSSQANKPSYLFMLHADHAEIIQTSSGYALTLHPINEFIYYFSERPMRTAGKIPLDKFCALWYGKDKCSFKNDHPNAALATLDTEGALTDANLPDHFLVLAKPVYNKNAATLTFKVKSLKGQMIPKQLGDCALFIDSAVNVNGGF